MSDTRESEDGAEIVTEEPDTYVVTVKRQFEMDIGSVTGKRLQKKFDAKNTEEALANSVAQVEAREVEPTQKLLNLDVDVDGPSDD